MCLSPSNWGPQSDIVPQRSGPRKLQPGKSAPPEMTCSHKCVVKEDIMLVNKKSFVAFICKVVNVAVRQEKKSDRIKIVVEAAEEFLGIKDLNPEDIHGMFSASNDGRFLNDRLETFHLVYLIMVFLLLQWNARSLIANGQLTIEEAKDRPDIVCIQETWLRPHLDFILPQYESIRSDRIGSQGGGCATFVREGMGFRRIVTLTEIECVVIEICKN